MSDFNHKHFRKVVRHIQLVQSATLLLGERLIESGRGKFGRDLVARGLKHDQSKFEGVEWDFLVLEDDEDIAPEEKKERDKLRAIAWQQHVKTNDHHPEHWDEGINEMSNICIAEMVCDWYARGQEQGTDLRSHIKTKATKRFGMSLQGKTYKQIKYFVDMLLDPSFKPLKKVENKIEKAEETKNE